jgi:hypothetical protein
MVIQKDDKLIDFDPSYPFLLPENWKDKAGPNCIRNFGNNKYTEENVC